MGSGDENLVCSLERENLFILENDEALLHSFAGELAVLCTADVLCDANVSGWAARIVNPARADFCTQDSAASVLDAIFANRTRCNELLHALDKAFCRLRNHCHVEACVDGVLDGVLRRNSGDESGRVIACGAWRCGTFDAFPVGDDVTVKCKFGLENACDFCRVHVLVDAIHLVKACHDA